jgi:hypothetical protein
MCGITGNTEYIKGNYVTKLTYISLITYKILLLFEVIGTFRRLQQYKTFRSNCMFVFTYETVDLRS